MDTLEEYEMKIYMMRQALYKLIDKKENLLDKEVIRASQELDKALNDYNNKFFTSTQVK